ncbi:unnamed protein product [Durusdinium trenchii]|uniref:Uncharacterized protein n=1 Tax=Durusdinium trenchii TaxID=1381693 RepID=A0ABP0JQU9_9DINO
MVKAFAKLNCFFSFSASILHIPKHAAALKAVPEERLLLETDSPDQLPRSLRGGVAPNGEEVLADDKGQALNEPCWLPLVLEAAAMHRQVPEVQLAEVTARNAERLFRCPAGAAAVDAGGRKRSLLWVLVLRQPLEHSEIVRASASGGPAFKVLLPFVPLAERVSESLKTAESLRHDPEEEDSQWFQVVQEVCRGQKVVPGGLQGNWVESEVRVDPAGPLQKSATQFRESDQVLQSLDVFHWKQFGSLYTRLEEYSDAAHGLFKSLNKFQDSARCPRLRVMWAVLPKLTFARSEGSGRPPGLPMISEFRGKVADANSSAAQISHKVDTIKEKMSVRTPRVSRGHADVGIGGSNWAVQLFGPHPQDEYSEVDDEVRTPAFEKQKRHQKGQEWKKSQWKEARENEKKSRKTENEVGASAMETDEHQKDWSGLNSGVPGFLLNCCRIAERVKNWCRSRTSLTWVEAFIALCVQRMVAASPWGLMESLLFGDAGDVTRCDYKSWHRVDGVISGPPCAMRRRSAEMA